MNGISSEKRICQSGYTPKVRSMNNVSGVMAACIVLMRVLLDFPTCSISPSRTMLTSETQVGRTSHVVTDFQTGKLRVLTPIECERLNGFPDNWTNTGMPEKMQYFCMGNALVVNSIYRIGCFVKNDNYT